MHKLVSAGIYRVKKSKLLWGLVIFSALFVAYMTYSFYRNQQDYQVEVHTEDMMFTIFNFLGVLIAVFVSVYIGTDYSDGTIKNKLIVGYARWEIYLSNLIISTLAGTLIALAYMVLATGIGIAMFGLPQLSMAALALAYLDSFLLILCFSSLYTMLAMLISNRTTAAITAILLAFGMMFFASYTLYHLSQPPTTPQMNVDTKEIRNVPNPGYLTGEKRELYEFMIKVNPAGQGFLLPGLKPQELQILWLYSGVLTLITTGGGYLLFQRKDLK